jgi:hypothetical protein
MTRHDTSKKVVEDAVGMGTVKTAKGQKWWWCGGGREDEEEEEEMTGVGVPFDPCKRMKWQLEEKVLKKHEKEN